MRISEVDVAGYERVARAEDPETGLLAFISVHSTALGPAVGGMRLWPYADEDEALTDVLRLSRGMTYKSAVARTGLGGGKSIVVADRTDKSPELLEGMGRFVDLFGGRYITAEDVNVHVDDLRHVRRATRFVAGLPREDGGGGDPGPYTAYGTYFGVRASLGQATGDDDLAGRTVAVQGVGSVGFELARRVRADGAAVIVSDVSDESVARAVAELGASAVAPDEIYDVRCDAFAPCALGGVLNAGTITRLACSVVAGAANNQLLDEDADAAALRERGSLYAPDYVVNAGGIMNVSGELGPGGYDEAKVLARIETIPEMLRSIFARARERGITPHAAAQELAEAALGISR